MSSELFLKVPPAVVPPKPVVETPPLPEPPGEMLRDNPERIQAVDATFSHLEEKGGFMDMLGVYAMAMWVADFAKDTLRPPPASQDEPESPPDPEEHPA